MSSRRTAVLRIAVSAMILGILLGSALSASTRYEDGSLVLKMRPGSPVDGVVAMLDARVDKQLSQLEIYLLSVPTNLDLDSVAEVVTALPGVEFCQPNYLVDPLKGVQGSLPVSDAQRTGDFGNQEAAQRLALSQAHAQSTGAGVRVAVLDGGVNYNHPVLSGSVVKRRDYVDSDNDPFDEVGGSNSGHGTFVAGVIKLAAPGAEIYAYRVTDLDGLGNGYVLAEAIVQAVNDGCKVINLSLVMMERHDAIAAAAAYAAGHGVLIVAAAGNGHTPGAHYPASDPNVLCVAAVDVQDILADFSCYGDHVDICAPGTGIYGPYLGDGFAWWAGTSFAAPFVAAQAALLWYYEPTATLQQVIDAILSTATNLDDFNEGLAGQLGAGLINPVASIIMIRGGSKALRVPSEYPTIQAALDASLPGDSVLVASGEYAENLVIGKNRAVLLLGETGASHTILRPASLNAPTIYLPVRGSSEGILEIAGLTITGAEGPPAIQLVSEAAVIRDNIFRDNQVYINTNSTWYTDNATTIHVYGHPYNNTDIRRNLFINNGGVSAICIASSGPNSTTYVTNNTFYGNNRAVINDEHYICGDVACYHINVRNNLFANCRYEAISDATGQRSRDMEDAAVAYNIFRVNGAPWSANLEFDSSAQIFGDPMLANPAQGDARLLPGSAAINAGDPEASYNDPDGSRNDIGALSFEALPMPFARDFEIVSFHTLVPELRWEYVDNRPTTQQMFQIQVGTDSYWDVAEMWDSGPISSSETDIFYSGPPLSNFVTYYFRIRLHNGTEWGDWYEINGRFKGVRTIRVPGDMASIQDAVDLALEGDTVLIAPGTYRENVAAECKGLVLTSSAGAHSTTLIADLAGSAAIMVQPGIAQLDISGITFADGDIGISVSENSRCNVRDCRFARFSGFGIKGLAEALSVAHCEFIDNYEGFGCRAAVCRFDSNFVSGSVTSSWLAGEKTYARNNIFARNAQGLTTGYGGYAEVAYNTIYGSEAGGLNIGCAGDYYSNLIVFGRGAGITVSSSLAKVRYNNAYGNKAGNRVGYTESAGGLSADPLIIDTTASTFALRYDSPCINAGDPDPSHNDPDGSRSDIGAVSGSPVVYPIAANLGLDPVNAYGVLKSGAPTMTWTYLDPSPTSQYQYEAQLGTDPLWLAAPIWTSGQVASGNNTAVYDGPALTDHAIYFMRLRVHDGTQWGDWNSVVVRVSVTGRRLVPQDQPTISQAVAAAFDGDSVIVGPGTYQDSVDFAGKALVLTSSGGPEATILTRARTSQSVLIALTSGEPAAATISNLTITNNQGGGILVKGAAATVEGCILTNCQVTALNIESPTDMVIVKGNQFLNCANYFSVNGGGVRISNGLVLVESNRFSNLGTVNGGSGGALWVVGTSSCTVKYNLFTGNAAALGGAICADVGTTLRILGNTFYGNRAKQQQTGSCLAFFGSNSGVVDIENNIFARNGLGFAVCSNRSVTCNYNDAFMNDGGDYYGVTPGAGSIAVDPQFVNPTADDFHLTAGSPCIDAGDPGVEFTEVDGTRSDMGAFSYQLPQVLPVAKNINVGDENPRRVASLTPTFFWSFKDDGGTQQLHELQLAAFPPTWEGAGVWSSGEVNSADTSAVYAGPSLTRGGNYVVRVRVSNGSSWGSWNYLGIHIDAGPSSPQLEQSSAPESRYVKVLNFGACSDPEKDTVYYDIQFAADAAMTNIIAQVEHSSSPVLAVGFEAELSTVYYWRARATDGLVNSPWVQTTYTICGLGGRVELVSPTDPEIPCGQTVRFVLGIENNQSLPAYGIVNGFSIASPEGAVFDPIVVRWAFEGPVWDSAYLEGSMALSFVKHFGTVDSVTFLGLIMPVADNLLFPGAGGTSWYIETQIPCDEIGKQICIDNFDHSSSGIGWDWYYSSGRFLGDLADHTYPAWGGPYCFTIAQCCKGVRGDVNDDGQDCTIGDIAALVDHLFISCPELACIDESNINADAFREVSIGDITYAIDHLFITQRALIPCAETMSGPQAKTVAAEPTLWRDVRNDTTSLYLSTETMLRGVQLSLVGEGASAAHKLVALGLDLVQGRHGDTLKVGLADLDGPVVIEKGDWALISVPGVYRVVDARAADPDHHDVTLELKDGSPNLPTRFELSQNYPNPFNPVTTIEFALPQPSSVRISVINVLGQTVDVLVDRTMPAGYHKVDWNAGKYASGVYFYRLRAGDFVETRKMMLLK